jgi:hypothetical protein
MTYLLGPSADMKGLSALLCFPIFGGDSFMLA